MEIIYNPNNVGKEIISKRGSHTLQRKYHLTDKQIEKYRNIHNEYCSDLPEEIRCKAGDFFFNPYRKGIYWAQLQSLYELGANEWHDFMDVLRKTEEIARKIPSFVLINGKKHLTNQWDSFSSKSPKAGINSKDYIGRLRENFIFMQRLSCHHPSGYKLRQAHASLDLKKVSKVGFSNGLFYYRLSTYRTEEESIPVRDFSEYKFDNNEKHYYTYKFVGKIITKDKVIYEGVEL